MSAESDLSRSDSALPGLGDMDRTAAISDCGTYRYALTRRWSPAGGSVLFVMLNPSTADAEQDDPTIRRCIGFAKAWGFGRLLVGNLYAYRSTDPDELDRVDDPVGPENSLYLRGLTREASLVIAAWGAKPNRGSYTARELMATLDLGGSSVQCLGVTKDGHPRHPLYLAKATEREFFIPPMASIPHVYRNYAAQLRSAA